MKLVMTIVSNSDAPNVLDAIAQARFFATKVSTTGQFLVDGHTAILIGTDDDKVQQVYSIIEDNVKKRVVKKQNVTSTVDGSLLNEAVNVEEYGAVAFTINVEDFKKI